MNYFEAIRVEGERLDKLGTAYLKNLPFMSNATVLERLWNKANALLQSEGWDDLPDWASCILDGGAPYGTPKNGSLYYALGFSPVSNDAHLRNLLERVEGRETKELRFPILADKKRVNKLERED